MTQQAATLRAGFSNFSFLLSLQDKLKKTNEYIRLDEPASRAGQGINVTYSKFGFGHGVLPLGLQVSLDLFDAVYDQRRNAHDVVHISDDRPIGT